MAAPPAPEGSEPDGGPVAPPSGADPAQEAPERPAPGEPPPDRAAGDRGGRRAAARTVGAHLFLLACYVGGGITVTWPTASILVHGRLLWVRHVSDISSYVWALWWIARQVTHLGNPWYTHYMAAPVGISLGFDTLMPLPGLVMTPVTLLFGPVASFAVLTIVTPGLLCYVTYRAARLWLGQAGAITAGAFFGLSTMVTWQDLYHLNIAMGTLFLPLTLEVAVRLTRRPGRRQGILLGLVLGASVLTNQESAVVSVLLAAAILVPWLVRVALRERAGQCDRRAAGQALVALVLGAVVGLVVASPQLFVMARQVADGGTVVQKAQITQLTDSYRDYGVGLPSLFSPSPRFSQFRFVQTSHLQDLTSAYQFQWHEGRPAFGVVLAVLAIIGLALSWRRRAMWWLALLWLAGAVLALGPTLVTGARTYIPLPASWQGVTVSQLMPYTWLIRLPGLSALREADRLALLGLLGAAILAGAAVHWLTQHARPAAAAAAIVVIAAAGFLEAGWSTATAPSMPAALPSVDGPIAADHSGSIVVDVPFGLRGGVNVIGQPMPQEALVQATADGHPRAVSYTSWVPLQTINGIGAIAFYKYLDSAETGGRFPHDGPDMIKARRSAARADVGWAIVWHRPDRGSRTSVVRYLYSAGFKPDYHVNTPQMGITVWRRA